MKIENAVVLVTGANRGIGLAFVRELLARGARKVYAAARDPASITPQPGVQALRLDVNNPADVAAPAALAPDVTLVVNNAGHRPARRLFGGRQRRGHAPHVRDQRLWRARYRSDTRL